MLQKILTWIGVFYVKPSLIAKNCGFFAARRPDFDAKREACPIDQTNRESGSVS
jgi:hypothetical protein